MLRAHNCSHDATRTHLDIFYVGDICGCGLLCVGRRMARVAFAGAVCLDFCYLDSVLDLFCLGAHAWMIAHGLSC